MDRVEPPEVECTLSTQNESQEARKLTDISITHSSPDTRKVETLARVHYLRKILRAMRNKVVLNSTLNRRNILML